MQTYAELADHWKKIVVLQSTGDLLGWDTETMMPEGVAKYRGEQFALISQLVHSWTNQNEFKNAVLSKKITSTNEREKRNLELWERSILRSTAVDAAFIEKRTKASLNCNMTWRKAKKESDFALVRPALEKVIELEREYLHRVKEANGLKEKYKNFSIYEVAFDGFETSFPLKQMEKLLTNLCQQTQQKLPQILERTSKWKRDAKVSHEKLNKDFCKKLMETFGFDFKHGRLDESTHPFCGGSLRDVRLTTRIAEKDPLHDLSSALHEMGHALYEQGLPEEQCYEPAGLACSMGVHESQSRFFENFIGRSKSFAHWLAKEMGVDETSLYGALNPVKLDFIRVDADEVTYNLHIFLRLKLERELMENRLQVKDLPEKWNTLFKELTGLKIEKDSQGCLQDTHWYGGAFGYFPTYSLGNMFAAELFADFEKAHADWSERVARGDLSFVRNFMAKKVYPLASHNDSSVTMRAIIGRDVSEQALLDYFDKKFV